MAILIPSKNIYDKQNPKVRDNVIERIEVNAVEVLPDNEYETPVYNENFYANFEKNGEDKVNSQGYYLYELSSTSLDGNIYSFDVGYAHVAFLEGSYRTVNLIIPILQNNRYISKIYDVIYEKNSSGENEAKSKIGISIYGKKEKRQAKFSAQITDRANKEASIKFSSYIDNEQENIPSSLFYFDEEISVSQKIELNVANKETLTAKLKLSDFDKSNLLSAKFSLDEKEENFIIELNILSGFIAEFANGSFFTAGTSDANWGEETREIQGERVIYNPEKIEITIYGNTIGIDLTDKTVYIPETDTTSKKVFSVSGNELMQVDKEPKSKTVSAKVTADKYDFDGDGYYLARATFTVDGEITSVENTSVRPNGVVIQGNTATIKALSAESEAAVFVAGVIYYKIAENTIADRFTKTLTAYKNGKETATIRCDISDYYEYNATAEDFKGNKVIAIDNSTGKMSFKMYDQVIPMVYGADGKDRPMSLNKDGSPKVFEVLGSKIYYDGAIWQEISLQET